MSNLVAHAERELRRTGWLDGDNEQSGLAILAAVKGFATGGWSGGSVYPGIHILSELLKFQPLAPLTDDPAEWQHVTHTDAEGKPLWQSNRRSSCFSNDGGKTYYDIDEVPVRYGFRGRISKWFGGDPVGFTSVGRDRHKLKRHTSDRATVRA